MVRQLDNLFAISTDITPFSIWKEGLRVLLVPEEDGKWKLPGGSYIATHEDLDSCVRRHLYNQTGLKDVYLEQLYTFACPDGDPQQPNVSVTYFALVSPENLKHCAQCPDNHLLRWFSINDLPLLILNQTDVIAMAYKRLAAKLSYSTIALQLMPEQFTLRALQSVYETILEASLDKRNFRKRMLAMNCIEATSGMLRQGKHRPARLYRVKTPGKVEFIR
jgi:8-oxo-dGTP diphosphatase